MRIGLKGLSLLGMLGLMISVVSAREYHVSVNGNDANKGTKAQPFRTIQAAADAAQPGDVITVHEGIYRERVNPPRGGTSEKKRITYRAAKGEKVAIKGSEIVKGWEKVQDNTWKVVISNEFFGDYNPYKDIITGDWFKDKGRPHHTGEVYLNGKSLFEKATLDEVLNPQPYPDAFDKEGSTYTWYCESDHIKTTIWANFHDADPNHEIVEINVRKTCFYPNKTGVNYITVRGFVMSQAATQWAPPTAEQIGLIGTHWSKGWIIENNVISDSKCVGITLGKHGDEYDNTSENTATGYVETIKRAQARGWSKENIGSHIVRSNTVFNCEAAGICGSMGGICSEIIGNHIYNIQRKRQFHGAETGGIKLHAPIDTLIRNNYIHHSDKGIWLDWMTQGTRISANLCHDNFMMDFFSEVNHGPYVTDNNIFLSDESFVDWSDGGAFSHNLFLGNIQLHRKNDDRQTPYMKPHSTEIAGLNPMTKGDNRFYNNIFCGKGLDIYNDPAFPMHVSSNVYFNEAKHFEQETHPAAYPGYDPKVELVKKEDGVYLHMTLPESFNDQKNSLITTKLLGKSKLAKQFFTDYDGSLLQIDRDYFGKKRNQQNPTPGPFEKLREGELVLKVWQFN